MKRSAAEEKVSVGPSSGSGRRFLVLVSRFNQEVTGLLLDSARACLMEHGTDARDVVVHHVPGAWELPQAALRGGVAGRYDAVLALGCVIRGETAHFEYISAETARGLGAAARQCGIPVTFGVLTTDTHEQAIERARPGGGQKGREAALAALEMVELFERLG